VSFRARIAPWLFLGALAGARVDAQQVVVVRDPGPGSVGHRLAQALAAPHRLVIGDSTPVRLSRDSAFTQTVIVLHRDVVIEARIHGDVIVVGGDAFLHPGAVVDGRVIAIGGAVYESNLAITRGGTESHRDFTFSVRQGMGAYELAYQAIRVQQPARFSLPGLYGFRLPAYDRIDGLSLPFGPFVSLDTGRYELQPTVTYRSNLGAFDPGVNGTIAFSRRTSVNVFVGRSTLTNDYWIWSDLVNSAAVLALGLDTRNYYRADRAQVTVDHLFETPTFDLQPYVGARAERDRSVARDSLAQHVPWSFAGRTSADRMRRLNPAVLRGSLQSALFGGRLSWEQQRVRVTVDLENEAAAFSIGSLKFAQSILFADVRFPTFGAQEFYLSTHVVHTFGDTAPPQRWSYLGGSGTLPTMELLSMGGDRLLYVESNYFIPIEQLDLPVVGAPSVTLRHMIGSAGLGKLPAFHQNLGLRVALSFARVDITVDPTTRTSEFSAGLSLAR
jgi:hypothetical protein